MLGMAGERKVCPLSRLVPANKGSTQMSKAGSTVASCRWSAQRRHTRLSLVVQVAIIGHRAESV